MGRAEDIFDMMIESQVQYAQSLEGSAQQQHRGVGSKSLGGASFEQTPSQ